MALKGLAEAIEDLPEADRTKAFGHVFEALEVMPPEEHGEGYTALARSISDLPPDDQMSAFKRVLNALRYLPAEPRSEILTALAFAKLPKPERTAGFNSVLDTLDDPFTDESGKTLKQLAFSITSLPAPDQTPALNRILDVLEDLSAERRSAMLEMLGVLASLIKDLPAADQAPAFDRVLAQLPSDALNESHPIWDFFSQQLLPKVFSRETPGQLKAAFRRYWAESGTPPGGRT